MFNFGFHNFIQKLNCLQGLNFKVRWQDLTQNFEIPNQKNIVDGGGSWPNNFTILWRIWLFETTINTHECLVNFVIFWQVWVMHLWIFYCETIAEIHGFFPCNRLKSFMIYSCNQQTNIKIFSCDQLTNFTIFTETNRWILRFFSHDRLIKLNSHPPP